MRLRPTPRRGLEMRLDGHELRTTSRQLREAAADLIDAIRFLQPHWAGDSHVETCSAEARRLVCAMGQQAQLLELAARHDQMP